MKAKIAAFLAVIFLCSLSGCGKTAQLSQYNLDGIAYLSYTDIDTVCGTPELAEDGANLLSSLEDDILLSFVVDSSIEISDELGAYDHLILTNPKWIEKFGDPDKLSSLEYDDLSDRMQEFLTDQMPLWTIDGSVLPDGVSLYQYENGKLLAFPVNVTLGTSKAIEAKNPLIILVDEPAQILDAAGCMLPLTSSGNVLFVDKEQLEDVFVNSKLRDYGSANVLDHTGK